MRIEIWLKNSSQPVVIWAENAYVKGPFYCVYEHDHNRVIKYPLIDIFRVIEQYQPTGGKYDKSAGSL